MIRRTSRGVSRAPRRLRNTASAGVALGDQLPATTPEPARDRLDGRLAHGDLALLRSLSPHRDRARSAVEVGRREATQLGDAQPAAVQQLEHGVVTQADGVVVAFDHCRGFVEEHPELVAPEHSGQARLALRRVEAGRGVDGETAGAHQPREVTAQRRGAPTRSCAAHSDASTSTRGSGAASCARRAQDRRARRDRPTRRTTRGRGHRPRASRERPR